ncbi:hypothetical protein METSCH_C03830 [Metschnikowia aff. pulcherrima]|uniref:Uncharacterized protein n=1 Tax=Metschnikowia aff. pulcherrima TaxID=2163413 RepID=A0A4P6XP43_9ASCO|nr:hypothetical protein METSCH_C03830 [Metschnikowia aff. pulcherrima]
MRINLALLVVALIANKIGTTPIELSGNETSGVIESEQTRPPESFLHGRLVYGWYSRLRFVKDLSPEETTRLVNTSLRNFVRELKGFISTYTFRFVLFQRKIEHFASTLREIEGLMYLGEHSEEAQQRLAYSRTLFITMARTAINMRRFMPLTEAGDLAILRMSLIHLKALALHDSRGEFNNHLAHSVRRIMCLKQDVDSWEAAFGKLENVHFLTKLIFSDLVERTRAQIKSLENKTPRDREFWSKEGQPRDGDFYCLA